MFLLPCIVPNTIEWPGSGPLLYIYMYVIGSKTCEWTHSLISDRTGPVEFFSILWRLAMFTQNMPSPNKNIDKCPVFRLFLLSSSFSLVSWSFQFFSIYFCTCLYFCSIKKVPLRFSFNFSPSPFFPSFLGSLFIVVYAWFLLLLHCDSLGYLWDCSMCPHAVRLSGRGVCAGKL